MENKKTIIEKADFNPKISIYILLVVAFFIAITFVGIPLLLVWFLGLGQYFGKRYYRSLRCELTTKHLEFEKGVFFKVEKTIPLENIQDLTFVQNPILSYLGLKILKVETAGSSGGQNGSDMKLVGIIGAHDFKEKVLAQRQLLQSESNIHDSNNSDSNNNTQILNEIKAVLSEINSKIK